MQPIEDPAGLTVSLADAAQLLSLSWSQTWRLVLTGRLDGRRLYNKQWVVTKDSLTRFAADRPRD